MQSEKRSWRRSRVQRDLERVDTVERRPDRVHIFLRIDLMLHRVLILSEPETVRSVGITAENTNDVPTMPEPAQDLYDAVKPLATEVTGVSICVTYEIRCLVKLIL